MITFIRSDTIVFSLFLLDLSSCQMDSHQNTLIGPRMNQIMERMDLNIVLQLDINQRSGMMIHALWRSFSLVKNLWNNIWIFKLENQHWLNMIFAIKIQMSFFGWFWNTVLSRLKNAKLLEFTDFLTDDRKRSIVYSSCIWWKICVKSCGGLLTTTNASKGRWKRVKEETPTLVGVS